MRNIQVQQARINRYFELPVFKSIKDGMSLTIPFTVIGSIFLLLLQIKILPTFLTAFFSELYGYSFNCIGLIACIGITYSYKKNIMAVISVTLVYLMMSAPLINGGNQQISFEWLGSNGIITAIITGTTFSALYHFTNEHQKQIKSFKELPESIKGVFDSIFPSFMVLFCGSLTTSIVNIFTNKSISEMIYVILQIPLQNVSDSLVGVIVISLVISIFWFFGIHGNVMIGGVITPILLSNSMSNQELIGKGGLTVNNGAHIVTYQFLNQFITMSGSGITIGLIFIMMFFTKKSAGKQLGKLSLIPSVFNINETVVFGVPLILNPYMFIPFVLVPLVSTIALYFFIYFGLIPPFNGVILPWITPPIVSGFLLGNIKYVLFQIAQIIFSMVIYYPFYKKYESIDFEKEK